jgi:hypothetical protein
MGQPLLDIRLGMRSLAHQPSDQAAAGAILREPVAESGEESIDGRKAGTVVQQRVEQLAVDERLVALEHGVQQPRLGAERAVQARLFHAQSRLEIARCRVPVAPAPEQVHRRLEGAFDVELARSSGGHGIAR